MGVIPDDFESHSNRVESDYSDEISRRCVISRKYYWIFHMIREGNRNSPQVNWSFSGPGNDHKKASDLIKKKSGKNLADDFDDLRKARNRADYDIHRNIDPLDLGTFNQDAQNFILNAKMDNIL